MESTLRQRRNPEPDVPEDVAFLHLNDPNWDPPSSASYSDDGFSVSERKGAHTFSSGFSIRSSDVDVDSESHTESSYKATESRYHLSEAGDDYADESPYAEVRAAVSNVDDPSMPVNTFRMWFLGIFVTILMSGVNHVMVFRAPSVGISALVILLISLPLGRAMEYLPRTRFNTFGYVWSLNPGPFNIKEHAVIVAMANIVYNDSFVTYLYAVQELFYGQSVGAGYKILTILSTQLIGFSYTAFVRQFLVYPPSMIWPGALVQCALLNTLHRNYGKTESKHMSRERFFLIVTAVGAIYYFIPGFLFTALSVFTWVCWIAPQNQIVNSLFGYNTGLGMGFLTFDWNMVANVTNPLVSPWWAELNVFAGFTFFMWFLAPIFYYRNVFFAKFMPISAAMAFDNTGAPYDISNILTNSTFDLEKYTQYSPLYLPATFYLSYGAQFAALTCVVVHTILWYRHDMIRQFRRSIRDERDVHSRLMSVYPDIPHWWYAAVGLVTFAFAIGATHIVDTDLPVWGLIIAFLIGLIFIVPVGMLRAMTNQIITLNVFSEFIAGYMFPGKPVAVLLFKTYSYGSMQTGLTLIGDLKMGHYMKVPPRIMFSAQVVSSIVGSLVMYGTQEWLFATIPNMCTPEATSGFICPTLSTVATSSMIWGAIGPQRIFSHGALYWPILFFFLIGAVAPIPFYLLARRYPSAIWRYVNMPLFFTATGVMPPASGINFSSWIMVGAVFQWFMRRAHFRWWMRYNYILAAALDSGVIIGAIVIFLVLMLPKGGIQLNWWGNTVWMNTFDAMGMPAAMPDPGDFFGLRTW